LWRVFSAANSCPASPRGGHARRNISADLHMVAAYVAKSNSGGSGAHQVGSHQLGSHQVGNTVTVATSGDDRSVASGPGLTSPENPCAHVLVKGRGCSAHLLFAGGLV